MQFIIKIFPEIAVKSRPVRKQFIAKLRRNISKQLANLQLEHELIGVWDNIRLRVVDENPAAIKQLISVLQHTPGISQMLQVNEYDFTSLADIAAICLLNFADDLVDKSFVVRCKRIGNHDFTSHQAEQEIGGILFSKSKAKRVDLHNPQITIRCEINKHKVFVVTKIYQGLGGYPLGAVGQTLVLMSGGFDSTVATYQLLRRGVQTHFIFFNLGGSAHEIGVKQVAHFLWQKYSITHRSLFISVPFEQVLGDILTSVYKPYMGVILKRCMLRAANVIADKLSLQTLVTGESISQVASQTVENLALIDEVSSKLVMRPLLTMHKQEIINIAEHIGTADFVRHIPEYCGVISVNPTTCGKLDKCLHEETKLNDELLNDAVENAVIEAIDNAILKLVNQIKVEEVNDLVAGQIVLDIRHPAESLDNPLNLAHNEVINMPFFSINSQFKKLDNTREYLLYCDKGVMSKLHASHLQQEGFPNVRIYRPIC